VGKEDVVNYDGAQLAEEGKTQRYLFIFFVENRMLLLSSRLVRKITKRDVQISTTHSDHFLKIKVNGERISRTHVRGGWLGTKAGADAMTKRKSFHLLSIQPNFISPQLITILIYPGNLIEHFLSFSCLCIVLTSNSLFYYTWVNQRMKTDFPPPICLAATAPLRTFPHSHKLSHTSSVSSLRLLSVLSQGKHAVCETSRLYPTHFK
jgi:hypothetical protein